MYCFKVDRLLKWNHSPIHADIVAGSVRELEGLAKVISQVYCSLDFLEEQVWNYLQSVDTG